MWLYFATPKIPGAWNSGMYPSDAAVLEDGVWRMDVNLIDETYFNSPSYADGWARPGPGPGRNTGAPATSTPPASAQAGRQGGSGEESARGRGAGGRGATVYGRGIEMAPDLPTAVMSEFRRKDFNVQYPAVKPMWFHYRNPVSGRTPPNYCPDIKSCYKP
jgi:hypothetical protein